VSDPGPQAGGIALRAIVPNAVTVLALCFGLTGVRFAVGGEWEKALLAVVFAGVLDAMDGRIARLLRAQSRFGAELDSLSDVIAFGVAPSVIIYLWSLHDAPKFGWTAALALAVCCALRLARFNARMAAEEETDKAASFYTGIPAPVGAGLAFVPIYLWFVTGNPLFQAWYVAMPWVLFIALLMISTVATYSWSLIRIRRSWRMLALAGIGLFGAALVTATWHTLLAISAIYLALLPFSMASHARFKRRRAAQPAPASGA
jgi:CDP-diacylglycerol--serine O-phosphatidyltransferase